VGAAIGGLMVAAVVFAGCGGSDESSISKAEFTKQANVICYKQVEKRNLALEAAYKGETGKYFGEKIDPTIEQKIFRTVYLPEMRAMAKLLAEVGYPSDDEDKAKEFVETLEAANDTIEENPEDILLPTTKTPVTQVDELAQQYGLGKCILI
jgi:ABC-type Fe3+-citrate transport system substrate-binding protein